MIWITWPNGEYIIEWFIPISLPPTDLTLFLSQFQHLFANFLIQKLPYYTPTDDPRYQRTDGHGGWDFTFEHRNNWFVAFELGLVPRVFLLISHIQFQYFDFFFVLAFFLFDLFSVFSKIFLNLTHGHFSSHSSLFLFSLSGRTRLEIWNYRNWVEINKLIDQIKKWPKKIIFFFFIFLKKSFCGEWKRRLMCSRAKRVTAPIKSASPPSYSDSRSRPRPHPCISRSS